MEKENKKRGNPAWQKGVSGNPNGRPEKSKKFSMVEFVRAVQKVEEDKKKLLYVHLVEQAFIDNRVLIALIPRIVPEVEVVTEEDKAILEASVELIPESNRVEAFEKYLN